VVPSFYELFQGGNSKEKLVKDFSLASMNSAISLTLCHALNQFVHYLSTYYNVRRVRLHP
jgi:hypothetical protein